MCMLLCYHHDVTSALCLLPSPLPFAFCLDSATRSFWHKAELAAMAAMAKTSFMMMIVTELCRLFWLGHCQWPHCKLNNLSLVRMKNQMLQVLVRTSDVASLKRIKPLVGKKKNHCPKHIDGHDYVMFIIRETRKVRTVNLKHKHKHKL